MVQLELFEVFAQHLRSQVDIFNHDEHSDSTQLSNQAHSVVVDENGIAKSSGEVEDGVSAHRLGNPVIEQPYSLVVV